MKYCVLCQKHVEPVKSKWNWGWFIILCFTVVGGIGYAVYHVALKSKEHCPICNTKKLVESSQEEIENTRREKAKIGNGPLDNLEEKVLKALNIDKPIEIEEKAETAETAETGNGPLDNLGEKVLKALNIDKTVN
ncbi:hypothetical protein SAMN05660297_02224 [Natronincola peptidivorans]|uniref:Uncharacterized protein n=1 Tax=Natronincola peptidivorans TaxID=426128 RepID=A0A1I0DYW8_9FIRM|nr:hypothetical protein [Natronincola peptidivorans]SET37936.1 hypothetical protein SAMN05660297_02224 [Natronincola peptidivorans]